MIAAAVRRDPDDLCTGCSADSLACARKAALGGRVCCSVCTHVKVRKVPR